MKKYGLIMAGGIGSRIWPLSRHKQPKQFLNLSGNELMINEAINRLKYIIPLKNIFIVARTEQRDLLLSAVGERIPKENIFFEPVARSTTACIGYAAIRIIEKYGDGIMAIIPSDSFFENDKEFANVLAKAIGAAEKQNKLVTIGIKPNMVETGYGYIKVDMIQSAEVTVAIEYKEKPNKETAEKYLKTGTYVWNSGVFIWKASIILKKYEQLVPDIYDDLCEIARFINTEKEEKVIESVYPCIREISIDYAIMEAATELGEVLVFPTELKWSDLGNWNSLSALHDKDERENITVGDVTTINTKNCFVYSTGNYVAAVGLDNIVIVQTKDATLVCHKDDVQDVKMVVDQLVATGRTDLI